MEAASVSSSRAITATVAAAWPVKAWNLEILNSGSHCAKVRSWVDSCASACVRMDDITLRIR